MEETQPAPVRPAPLPVPTETQAEGPRTRPAPFRNDEARDDEEEVLQPVANGERGRWRVIALALALTAAVAFGLTRGGEGDPDAAAKGTGPARSRTMPPTQTTGPASAEPVPCSVDPPPSRTIPEPADAVPAATADYLFQSSLSSSRGVAPDLDEIVGGSSIFTVDGRTGTTVLRFAGGRGLALTPTTRVIPSSTYTIEVLFRFDLLSGYRKIVDFKGGKADGGLYLLDGCLTFFPKQLPAITALGTGSYAQVVLTRDASGRVVGYVNGVRQFAFADAGDLAEVSERNTLRFFVDDHTTTGEYSSGAVSQIRLFDQALTANEVAALACTELAIADAIYACREPSQ
jgi:hypothetical protein